VLPEERRGSKHVELIRKTDTRLVFTLPELHLSNGSFLSSESFT